MQPSHELHQDFLQAHPAMNEYHPEHTGWDLVHSRLKALGSVKESCNHRASSSNA